MTLNLTDMVPKSTLKIVMVICGLLLASWVLLFAGILVYDMTGPGYAYNKAVSSHLLNAYELNTPEAMKAEILLAKQGMKDLSLESSDYCSILYWEQTPDCSMSMQYEYLDGLVDRVDSVIDWKDKMYAANNTAVETLGDVYEQKMDNLRYFLTEGGESDWIGRETYYAKNYPVIWWFNKINVLCCIGWAILAFLLFGLASDTFNL